MKFLSPISVDGYASADHFRVSTSSVEPLDVGKIVWNPVDGTFDMGLIGGVTLQAGQEMHMYGKASEAITNGDAIMFAGIQGNHILFAKAEPLTINANPEYFIGIATQDFTLNQFGYVTVFGNVRTLDTSAYTLGAVLYFASNIPMTGKLTATQPEAPNAKITVAAVLRVHATQGMIMVRPHVMPKIKNLQDVYAPNPTEGQGLFWNNTTLRYEAKSISTVLGYTPANDSNVVHKTGNETIYGFKTFIDDTYSTAFLATNYIDTPLLYVGSVYANYVSSGGNIVSYGDTYANYFYDINDSAYYLNPNSSSNLYNVTANKFIKSGGTSAQFLKADGSVDSNSYYLASNPNGYISSYTETDTLATVTGRGATTSVRPSFDGGITVNGQSYVTANGYFVSGAQGFRWNDSSGLYNNVIMRDNGTTWFRNYLETPDSMRSPIYYDYNDTSYYIDAASDSRMWRGRFGTSSNYMMLGEWDGVNNRIEAVGRPIFITSYGGSLKFGYQGAVQMELATNGVLSTSQYIYSSTYVQSGQSMYSPIYYDANDTAYFLDLNSTGKSAKIGGYLETYASANKAVLVGNWNGANYWGMGSNGTHTIRFDMVNADSSTFQGASDVNLQLGTNTVYHTGNNYGLELYKSQTVDMSNTAVFSTSNYYPVTIPLSQTEAFTIQIQNNLNSNVPSWATHGSGFTLNMKWVTNGSGWGTTEIKRKVYQYHERFANQTICGGITQMSNSSTEVVWLRGGGTYFFKFSRDLTATANSGTYTASGQSVSPTSSAQNTVWNSAYGVENYYVNNVYASENIYSPIFYDSNNTGYYVDPASTSSLNAASFAGNCSWFGGYGASSGLAFENQNSFARIVFWNLDFYEWDSGQIMTMNNGYVQANNSFRAPVFYDSNDTSYFFDGSSTGDSIRVAGDIVAYYSDERLKDRKGNIENALEKVLSLNGFHYTPNAKAQELGYKYKEEVGVSAQEVEAVLPEIIKNAPIGQGYKTLDYGKLTPLLIEAIKEQQTQIEELKKLVNQLIQK